MKILFTRFPLESAYGGAEVQTLSLMKGLRDRGHAIAFAGSCKTLLRLCREEGFPVIELRIGPPPVSKWTALSFFWRKQAMQRQLEALLSQFSSLDAICMLSFSEKILLTPAAVARGIRTLWIEHDRIGPWLTKNPWLKKLRDMSARVTTIGVSELSRKLLIDLGWSPQKTIAIPNGIDLEKPKTQNPKPETCVGLHLGCVARLTEDKGVDLLIEAVSRMPEVTLSIVGSGREEGYIRTLIETITRREGLSEPRIRLHRSLPDILDFYASIDALVLPSREHDPFGLVAAEAMAAGIPAIVTNACGIAEYLTRNHDALVVEANSVSALKEAVSAMRSPDVRERISREGKKTTRAKFGIEAMIRRYEEVLS
ncbi:MAG: glycosyltransferase family 4 protein [Patescibacteria group bacterium]